MTLDRLLGQEQLAGDLTVGAPERDQLGDLPLAAAQARQARTAPGAAVAGPHAPGETAGVGAPPRPRAPAAPPRPPPPAAARPPTIRARAACTAAPAESAHRTARW